MTIRLTGWQRHTLAIVAMSFSAMLFLWTAGIMRGTESLTIHEASTTIRFASPLAFAPDQDSYQRISSAETDTPAAFAGQPVVVASGDLRAPMSVSISEDGRSVTIKARNTAPSRAIEYAEILTARLLARAEQMTIDSTPLVVVPAGDQSLRRAGSATPALALLALTFTVIAVAGAATRTAAGRRAAGAFLHVLVR